MDLYFNKIDFIKKYKDKVLEKLLSSQELLIKSSLPHKVELVKNLNKELENEIGVKNLYHPFFFYWVHQYRGAVESKNSELAQELFSQIPQMRKDICESLKKKKEFKNRLGIEVDVSIPPLTQSNLLETGSILASDINKKKIELIPTNHPDNLKEAVEIIKKADKSYFSIIELIVTNLVFFSGKPAIGYSDIKLSGGIFLRKDLVENDTLYLAESIVHEASHNQLNILLNSERFLLNDDEAKYNTPLRRELRPMYGLFHQCFVLVNLAIFYNNLIKIGLGDFNAQSKRDEIYNHLEQALMVVNKNAKLNSFGEQILNELNEYYCAVRPGRMQ